MRHDIGDRLPQKGLIVFNGKTCQYRTLTVALSGYRVNGVFLAAIVNRIVEGGEAGTWCSTFDVVHTMGE